MAGSEASGTHNLVLVLGGARSGKSRHAEALIAAHPPPWIYIATGEGREKDRRLSSHGLRPG